MEFICGAFIVFAIIGAIINAFNGDSSSSSSSTSSSSNTYGGSNKHKRVADFNLTELNDLL